MNKIRIWINNKWTDPVWSKVFAGIILAFLSAFGALIWSLIKQIPIIDLYEKSINTYLQISYFSIILMTILFLSLIIPAILMNIIRFQLKNLKFPKGFRTNKFDLQSFLNGNWDLIYENSTSNYKDGEYLSFLNGNQYLINNRLTYVMTDIDFNDSKKILKWTKTRYSNSQKHSREELIIKDNNTMEGIDDVGFSLIYKRR